MERAGAGVTRTAAARATFCRRRRATRLAMAAARVPMSDVTAPRGSRAAVH